MAQRRMMSKDIIDTDNFLDMSQGSQNLYFHLLLRADDDGFVSNSKKIIRMLGINEDDFKVLVSKKYIIPFESGVCVIRHWRVHNYIQKDRYKETICLEEKALLNENNGMYTECIQDVSSLDTQVRLGKVRLGKERTDNAISDEIAPQYFPLEENALSDNKPRTKKEFTNIRRAELGLPPIKPKPKTTKQQRYLERCKLVDYFKQAVNQEHSKAYFIHPDDIKDIQKENSKIASQLKDFYSRCDNDLEKAKKVIDWYATEYGEFFEWRPNGCFRKDTVRDFENKNKKQQKYYD